VTTLGRDLKLTGLIPWLTRGTPDIAPIQTPELQQIYLAAQDNLWRADAIVDTVAHILYAVQARDGAVPMMPVSSVAFYQAALPQWESLLPLMPNSERGVEGIFTTFLVQGWTTLETLVADTWEAALNIHPRGLSNLNGRKRPGGEDKDKQFPLVRLQQYNYDVSRSMGSLLRTKYRFDDLDQVREAYGDAFGNEPTIVGPLQDQKLDALNAVRQVLVHRAGIADDKYVRDVKGKPLAPQVSAGTPLPIDGELTAALLLAGRPIGVALLKAVDDWLVANP
jgi:hypothetical protein